MASRLQLDLKRLDALAFHRRAWHEPVIRRYHDLQRNRGGEIIQALQPLYEWMFVPLTLWPFNIHDVFASCLELSAKGKPLDKQTSLLLEVLPAPPAMNVCEIVVHHEHEVQRGHYEGLVTTTTKFNATEKAAALDPALNQEWLRIKELWDVHLYCDHKGVIRRTLTTERNLRHSFSVNWKKRAERFQAVFDAFCLRWNLYGMQRDKSLLMKLSVNLAPHGTIIFVPAYWSFDPKRDVRWDGVMKLHRARAPKKQGAVLAEGGEHRRSMAEKLKTLDVEAKRLHLRGGKRHAFLCAGLGLVEATDPKRIVRLRKEFAE